MGKEAERPDRTDREQWPEDRPGQPGDDEERAEIAEIAAREPHGLDEFRATDRLFHAAVARACGNPLLTEVHAKLLAALFGSGEFASLLYAEFNRAEVRRLIESAVGAHRAIATAVAKGDRKRATK